MRVRRRPRVIVASAIAVSVMSVDEAADVLLSLDFAGCPNPVISIDEFGWDYDGGIDRHSAAILKAVHERKPGLKIAVWQMRGPVAPALAAIYRDSVELVRTKAAASGLRVPSISRPDPWRWGSCPSCPGRAGTAG